MSPSISVCCVTLNREINSARVPGYYAPPTNHFCSILYTHRSGNLQLAPSPVSALIPPPVTLSLHGVIKCTFFPLLLFTCFLPHSQSHNFT
ncbi:hypothetical protein Ciccas_001660 [Cichlidogyrus casuarinus]|uniref:Uncharacterized protein n=1 Tax=Cichlidogyrus casuarinus TaxID=1844966 RepID=A0ABD2QJG9_9PLAT